MRIPVRFPLTANSKVIPGDPIEQLPSFRVSRDTGSIKPLLVFAAGPYGTIGALIALAVMHTPFGFMAFLGVASLIGVIVSHVIVLFDFIEEMHEKGSRSSALFRMLGLSIFAP